MSTLRPDTRPSVDEDALLAQLGLTGSASDSEIEAAHDEIADFLARAPAGLRNWARERLADADEAYVLLRGTAGPSAGGVSGDGLAGEDAAPATAPAPASVSRSKDATRRPAPSPATAAPRRNGHHTRAAMLGDALGGGDWYEPSDLLAEPEPEVRPRPTGARRVAAAPVPRGRTRQPEPSPQRLSPTLRRAGLVAGVVVALGAVLLVGYQLGRPSVPGLTGTPVPQASGSTVDQAQVTAFMTRLAEDERDVEALQGLANLYFAANDFSTAATWLEKLLAVEPDNITALLGAGAAAYNLGRLDEAEAAWLKVVELEPENVEVHYDLGFLYLAQEPPDLTKVEAEWRKVIELDPDSDIARTVAAHLDSIVANASSSPGESPAASAAPSPEASAAPSPETSSEPTPAATEGE